jgi:hypothetical protein
MEFPSFGFAKFSEFSRWFVSGAFFDFVLVRDRYLFNYFPSLFVSLLFAL